MLITDEEAAAHEAEVGSPKASGFVFDFSAEGVIPQAILARLVAGRYEAIAHEIDRLLPRAFYPNEREEALKRLSEISAHAMCSI